ncbi:hypothetical protein [Streptomyces sudanensis]|uniref:hypothetical protein n=2 Tax=Streptomyces sudanensis TaxID=436397 RepID=UPI0020CEADDB|nr:hypothetical protein [Streptomyces sudanensis]MCP9956255.1 hypothetical protein [Streptomyces sudanensis]MCP9985467.1 hypothetical protein [Streptomyces sudanensis]
MPSRTPRRPSEGPPGTPADMSDTYRGEPADGHGRAPVAARAAYEELARRAALSEEPPAAGPGVRDLPSDDTATRPGDVRSWLAERRLLDETRRQVRSPSGRCTN